MVLYARGNSEKIRQLKKSAEDLGLEIVLYSDLPLDNVVYTLTNLPTQSHRRQRGIRLKHTVEDCGYEWTYTGRLKKASCPNCEGKVDIQKYKVS